MKNIYDYELRHVTLGSVSTRVQHHHNHPWKATASAASSSVPAPSVPLSSAFCNKEQSIISFCCIWDTVGDKAE